MKNFKNFLYYNWIKILAIVFIIVFGVVTLKQCSERKEIDLGILYVGESKSDTLPDLAQKIKDAGIIKDTDDNGEITLNTKSIVIPSSREHMIEQQVPEQIQVEIISGENLLYILDKETLISYAVDENFADISQFATDYGYAKDDCLAYDDGRIYAIPLTGNVKLKECNLSDEGMYVAVRNYLEKNKDSIRNQNARKALEYILQ